MLDNSKSINSNTYRVQTGKGMIEVIKYRSVRSGWYWNNGEKAGWSKEDR